MKRRFTVFAFLLVAVAALGLSWRNHRAIRRLDSEIATANLSAAQAQARLDQATRRIHDERSEIARLEAERPRAAKSTAPTSNEAQRIDWAQWLKEYEAKQRDPKVQLREMAANRAQLHTKYAPLYRMLSLPPQKIAALEKAEAREAEQQSDLFAAISSLGINPKDALRDPGIAAQYVAAARERDAEEKSTLGDADYAQLLAYRHTLPAREMVRGFAATATVAGEPLSASQAEGLVAAIAAACPRYAQGNDVLLLDVDWNRVDQMTANLLSPQQAALLQTGEFGASGGRYWAALSKEYNVAVAGESRAPH